VEVVAADQVGEQRLLAVAIDGIDELLHGFSSRVPGHDLDGHRVAQDAPRQPPDLVRERGREHEVLAARGQQLDDPLDVRQEAHVEHPVGLVQHQDLDHPEVGDPLADQVEEPTGRRDEDLDAVTEGLDLRLHRDAAVHNGRAERDRPAVGTDALVDLHGELARRNEDQGTDRVPRG
jgi:hypothetical protein